MVFTVTYRAKDGALREERVEAASRAECVAECRKRGISPTGLKEGKGMNCRQDGGSPSQRRLTGNAAILAAVVLAAIAGGAWWWFGRDGERPSHAEAPAKPKAVKPAKPERKHVAKPVAKPAPVVKEVKKPRAPETREERLAWFKKKYGDNIPENLKTTVYFLEHPPTTTYKPLPQPEDVFKHQSEKTIAAVLMLQPGTFVMRRTVYDESFDADFVKAVQEPTPIEEDDSDETKALKTAVNEVRAEWIERMKAGEKPSDIMNEAMNTAYELGKYTRELEELLHEANDNPSMTNEDVEDFVKAANAMLKEKGAGELQMPDLLRRQARLRRIVRKAQLEEQTQKGN